MKQTEIKESNATWTGKKFGGSHHGTIELKKGTLHFENDALIGGQVEIDMGSIKVTDLTGENKEKLEGHLKSEDFFGTDNHPSALLVFTDVEQLSNGEYGVTGDLTIKEKTNPITFDLKTSTNTASTKLVIDRSKFDVKYGSKSFFSSLGDNFIYDDFVVDVHLNF